MCDDTKEKACSDKLRRWPLPSTILRPTSPSSASPSFSSPFSLTLLLRNLEPKRLLLLIFCFFGCIHPVARHLAAQTTHANQPKWWCWREVVVVLAATIAHNQSRPWLGNFGKGVTLFFFILEHVLQPSIPSRIDLDFVETTTNPLADPLQLCVQICVPPLFDDDSTNRLVRLSLPPLRPPPFPPLPRHLQHLQHLRLKILPTAIAFSVSNVLLAGLVG